MMPVALRSSLFAAFQLVITPVFAVIALLTFLVIIGGIKSIGRFTAASIQSLPPASRNETSPCIRFSRAARSGGSVSAATRPRLNNNARYRIKHSRLPHIQQHRVPRAAACEEPQRMRAGR